MQPSVGFPLKGIIGVVANAADEAALAKRMGLGCIELRADLLIDKGLNEADLLALIKTSKKQGLGVLFTLRHPTHGGTFEGSEHERAAISLKAVEAGADMFDLEFGTDAAASVRDGAAAMILSYHDFNAMPTAVELQELTDRMQSSGARAIKVVPTASRLEDALTMLKWAGQGNNEVRRIGFAMGAHGACSRILTTVMGGEITYASFGAPVAPGQIDIDELVSMYRINALSQQSAVTAVCIDGNEGGRQVTELNASYAGSDKVAVGFAASDKSLIEQCTDWLPVTEIVG